MFIDRAPHSDGSKPSARSAHKPKRILQICNTDFYLSKFLSPLVIELMDRGHVVECATSGDHVPQSLVDRGVRVHQVEFPLTASPFGFTRSIRQLYRIIRAGQFDLVNSHNRNGSIAGRIATRLARGPVNLYTAHGFYFHDAQSPLNYRATVFLENMLAKITDYTMSQSDEDTLFMVQRGSISADRIRTIGNGIDHVKFSPTGSRALLEKDLGLTADVFRFGAVGRIVRGKGFLELIRAFAKFVDRIGGRKPVELMIIGGNIRNDISPFANRIREEIERAKLEDKVRVTGLVDNVEAYLECCDAFVTASHREGMPRALLEAMCMGLPVAATRIRGAREIIAEPANGILFDPEDVESCLTALEFLYRSDNRAAIGAANRKLVEAKYREVDYVGRQADIIEDLLADTAPRDPR